MYDELIKRLRECTAEQNGEKTLWHQAADAIEELQKRKHGKWERKLVPVCDDGIIMIPGNVCSECGGITTYNVSLFKYCPGCGADMRGES